MRHIPADERSDGAARVTSITEFDARATGAQSGVIGARLCAVRT